MMMMLVLMVMVMMMMRMTLMRKILTQVEEGSSLELRFKVSSNPG